MEQTYFSTAEFARSIGYKAASIRTAYWRNGHFYTITPVKLPGGKGARLLWPADAVQRLTAGQDGEMGGE